MGKSSSSSSSPLSSSSSSSLVSGYCCCSCKYSKVSGHAHAHVYKTRAYTTSCNAKKIQNGRYFYAMLKKESKILTQSVGQHFDFMWIMGLVANEKKRNCFWLLWRRSSHFIRCSNFNCVATDTACDAAASSVWFGVSKIASIKHIVIKVVMEILSMA